MTSSSKPNPTFLRLRETSFIRMDDSKFTCRRVAACRIQISAALTCSHRDLPGQKPQSSNPENAECHSTSCIQQTHRPHTPRKPTLAAVTTLQTWLPNLFDDGMRFHALLNNRMYLRIQPHFAPPLQTRMVLGKEPSCNFSRHPNAHSQQHEARSTGNNVPRHG